MDRATEVRPGYKFDSDDLTNEVFSLLSMFLASKPLAMIPSKKYTTSITAGGYRRTIEAVQDRHFELNAVHSLLYISGMLRIVEERADKKLVKTKKCGRLFEPLANDPIDLSFREACNKIIHARDVEFIKGKASFELISGRQVATHYFETEVVLFGVKGKKEWKAVLDVVEFCHASLETAEYGRW